MADLTDITGPLGELESATERATAAVERSDWTEVETEVDNIVGYAALAAQAAQALLAEVEDDDDQDEED